jgi:hypothetical protein
MKNFYSLFFVSIALFAQPLRAEDSPVKRNEACFNYIVAFLGVSVPIGGAVITVVIAKKVLKEALPETFDDRYDPLSDLYAIPRKEIAQKKIRQLIKAEGIENLTQLESIEFSPGQFTFKAILKNQTKLLGRINMKYEIEEILSGTKNSLSAFNIQAKVPRPEYKTEDPFCTILPAVTEIPAPKENVYYEFELKREAPPTPALDYDYRY